MDYLLYHNVSTIITDHQSTPLTPNGLNKIWLPHLWQTQEFWECEIWHKLPNFYCSMGSSKRGCIQTSALQLSHKQYEIQLDGIQFNKHLINSLKELNRTCKSGIFKLFWALQSSWQQRQTRMPIVQLKLVHSYTFSKLIILLQSKKYMKLQIKHRKSVINSF